MRDLKDIRFGRWLVVSFHGFNRFKYPVWLCRCDCGKEKLVLAGNLVSGKSTSCGCLRTERSIAASVTHGYARTDKTPTYRSWLRMKERCYNVNVVAYPDYGGRGITVCEQWKFNFPQFLKDMGERPAGKSIHRINNNGNYEPGNCEWATMKVHCNHRRSSRILELNGEEKTMTQWSEQIGVSAKTIWQRLDRGWSVEKALTSRLTTEP